ncbi:LIM/homeobox protein Lhx9-like [Penaeus chinensis]|uniref:LIM/homeobox protein Lhx9-like n=1 Tax=Penaeus chinensis TaxID=139456 RepID=UPI001FB77B5B|nr:LIM/homeobox protein Lhx9-like [Penaeus chinensis]
MQRDGGYLVRRRLSTGPLRVPTTPAVTHRPPCLSSTTTPTPTTRPAPTSKHRSRLRPPPPRPTPRPDPRLRVAQRPSSAPAATAATTTSRRDRTRDPRVSDPQGQGLSSGGGISSISSSGEGSNETSFCAGCSERIVDRFYLLAVERKWHAGCLRCVACHTSLDAAVTCFARDGHIFCREDYHRLFSMRRCARCSQVISSSELVMRAREFVYHVQCFTCAHCSIQLTKGDHFGMNGPLIYCRDHYQMSTSLEGGYITPMGMPPGALPGGPLPHGPHGPHGVHPHLPPEVMQGFPPPDHGGKIPFFNGVGAHHKGRPRKRKPKDEPMDTNMNIPGGYDPEGVYGPMGTPCQSVRTKRIRTSFKHHQLRTMKAYFALNHNPDAKDLKQLSQKTGLSKRVLQVWFQNARAKWRRNMISKDPKALAGGGGGEGGLGEGPAGEGSVGDYPDTPTVPPSAMSPDEGNSSQVSYQQMF